MRPTHPPPPSPPLPQVLPFASDETLAELEKNIGSLTSVTDMLHQGMGAREITARILGSLGCEEQNMTPMQPKYGPCEVEALKARMKRAVVSLGEAEVEDIVREHGAVKARDGRRGCGCRRTPSPPPALRRPPTRPLRACCPRRRACRHAGVVRLLQGER